MHEESDKALVLVVDDDQGVARLLERQLRGRGLVAARAGSGAEALSFLAENEVSLMLLDLRLPDASAPEVVDELERRGRVPPFVVITGIGNERVAVEMMKRGALDYVVKDGGFLDLIPEVIKEALERLARERALAAAETRLRLLESSVEQASDAILITSGEIDPPGPRIIYVNPAATRLTGYSAKEMLGATPRLFQGEETDRLTLRRMRVDLEAGRSFYGVLVNYRKDGTRYLVELRMAPVRDESGRITHWVSIQRDITERLRLEEQLRQSTKMEAIGGLAGGIAHDFNNMLAVIRGHTELLLDAFGEAHPLRSELEAIREAGEHSAQLTRQLLAFSRKQVLTPVPLDLGTIIERTRTLIGRTIGEDVELVIERPEKEVTVRADPGQIQQVLVNLAVNARDAMPTGGRLRLTLDVASGGLPARIEEATEAARAIGSPSPLAQTVDPLGKGVRPRRQARLVVEDDGIGMSQEIRARIFEPFFSTKPEGEGTGLGLATTYGIVRQSDGEILVDSTPGKGTRFTILLPLVEEEPVKVAEEPLVTAALPSARRATILVAEDEEMLRRLISQCLENGGYTVISARHGREALDLWEQHEGRIDLLATDVVMPVMSGPLLAERLLDRAPNLRTLFISGYAEDACEHVRMPREQRFFLAKPFTPMQLLRKVEEILDVES